jgi:RHS repeat-associated protein
VNYDKSGNITQLQKNGKMGGSFGMMDNLSYTYNGNRLTSVNDAVSGDHEVDFVKRGSGGYTYWENGALKSDENEQITNITYNTFLNQPEQVTLSDGSWIKHIYDGSGTLIKTEYSTGEYWEFTPGIVFKNGAFYQMVTPEGRAIYEGETWKLEFDYKDHTGNTRASFKADGNRLVQTAKTDTDPWGVILRTGQENSLQNRYEMQGHEREKTFNLNRINFGARTYNPTIGRFDRTDRFSEKYTSLSSYQYAANNPIRYIDINGDSLWIAHKGNNYLYNDGQLFNSDGSQFGGKMKGFLKQTVNALGQLNATSEGTALVSELQNSTNNFTIKDGNNSFVSTSSSKAGANLSEVQAVTGNTAGSSGSGGTIYWNANSSSGGLDLKGGTSRPAYVALGHEMAHASDANQGLLHFGNMGSQPMSFTNHQGTVYNYQYNGLLKSEWRAVYRENLIRGQAKLALRTYYGYDMTTGTPQPTGPRLLDSKNLPINYP